MENHFDKYKAGTVQYKDFLDIDTTRKNIFGNVLNAVQTKYPVSNEKYSLEIHEPAYERSRDFTLNEQKNAILDRQTLDWPLYGTWRLRDKATGNVLSEQRKVIARVPYMTPRGTFILRGNEYTLSNQQRLRPGIYSRKKDNGELEAHVNLMPGTGASFRVYMEPETGLFKLKIGQANVPAYPILRALGATDEEMTKAWGPDILAANTAKARNFDLAGVYAKLASGKVRRQHSDPVSGLKATFASMAIDPEVSTRNLGHPYAKLEPAALIRTMQKLLRINKGEEEQDDRDSQANMTIHGPEDLIAERISKDAGGMARNLLWKVSHKRSVDNIPSAYLTRQINAAIMTSGLGSCFDDKTLVLTKRGFIPWPEVLDSDEFACNIDDKIEYHKASRLIKEKYKGIMFGVNTKKLKYLVTPNHRLLVKSKKKDGNWHTEFAYETHNKSRQFKTYINFNINKPVTDFTISCIDDRHGHVKSMTFDYGDWAEFLGWWVAEGSVFKENGDSESPCYRVTIAQSWDVNPINCQRIADLLTRMGISYRYSHKSKDFRISNKCLFEHLIQFRGCENKRIPRYLFDTNAITLRRFFDAYISGDGTCRKKKYFCSTTRSYGLALDLVELAGHIGYVGRICDEGRFANTYVVSFGLHKIAQTTGINESLNKRKRPCSYYEQEYDGMVYCAEVPGNLLYVMREGKPHWSHNSLSEINPMEIMHQLIRVSRLGEGAITSKDAVPDEARNVQPSQLGLIDPVLTPECLDPSAEVLTKDGFKNITQINDNDLIMCDIDGSVELRKPNKIINEPYKGLMYGCDSDYIKYLVTPNHRMWVRSDDETYRFEYAYQTHEKTRAFNCSLYDADETVCVKPSEDYNPYYVKEYDGNVYCLSVPGEKFFVRYPGSIPFWIGNSVSIGIDSRLASGTMKGSDGQIYRKVLGRDGKEKIISGREMIHSIVAFPGEMEKDTKKVRASINGKIEYVDKSKVNYIIPSARDMFSHAANMVPMLSGIKGGRLLMGGKMIAQALPLQEPEAPLVQSEFGDGTSYEQFVSKFMGAQRAKKSGRVLKVTPDGIDVIYDDKTKDHVQLYNSFPLNQKTSITNTPVVKPGDVFKENQLLAHSNFTDKNGVAALGTNLRTAYMVMSGNFEDAIVISESAAKKLSSEHMYLSKIPTQENLTVGKKEFISNFPGKFTQAQLDNIDDNGVVKPGTVLHQGDPIALGVNRREPTKGKSILKQARSWNIPFHETWDHENPGVVTDVSTRGSGIKVAVKTFIPMKVGDKMVSRYANKGIVSKIYPDDQMPRNQDGSPFEVVFNPLGIISRVNNSLLAETALAKIARKTGKPYVMPGFTDKSLVEFALNELKKHNIPETETVYDPGTNKELRNIFTGEQFIMKLHHTAEGKTSARDVGVYSMDNTPAKGQVGQSKRIGNLEMNALLAHNVPAVIRDAKLIRGQRNDDYWRKFRLGLPVPIPQRPFVYDKFLSMLKAAGVNVTRKNDKIHVMAMTDKDVDNMAGDNELTSGDAINLKTMEPVKGGLFDVSLTGGRDSTSRWSKITLAEPLPNPTMEEPIRRLLGLTGPKFEELLRSPDGPNEILRRLKNINVKDKIHEARQSIKSGKASKRDNAVKMLQYLTTAERTGVHPSQWMITKVPVLPPAFRPISHVDGMELTSDANLLYKDLFEANKHLKDLKAEGVDIADDRMSAYGAVKAVVGLGDPLNIKNREKGVAGMLTHIFGKSSPKFGMFQQKLLSTTVDVVGRAVISPEPKLDMDQVGIPESTAWDIYRPHIMRRLARKYNAGSHKIDLTELAKWIVNRDPRAKKALEEEMENRPVIISRAPVWHKFGIMGAWPVLTEGNTMKLPPLVYPGFGADNDGDAMNFHVPASDEAVKEVIEKMLPSKNLISTSDFKLQMQPKQEFLLGLYLATKDKSKKEPRTFESREAAIKAALNGQIEFNDPVIIKGK